MVESFIAWAIRDNSGLSETGHKRVDIRAMLIIGLVRKSQIAKIGELTLLSIALFITLSASLFLSSEEQWKSITWGETSWNNHAKNSNPVNINIQCSASRDHDSAKQRSHKTIVTLTPPHDIQIGSTGALHLLSIFNSRSSPLLVQRSWNGKRDLQSRFPLKGSRDCNRVSNKRIYLVKHIKHNKCNENNMELLALKQEELNSFA
ncbi:hypothetical protein Syun_020868 [Stephania yunnanensis]|uniref:Uncharacterized protein n=1 Tax=Stephania yunnanensis TaxID=152371 RepID=A0AAP0NRT4_9MAGN